MFPDLFSIGPLTLHTYGLFVALGFVVALLVGVKIGKTAEDIPPQRVMDMGFIVILAGLIGSRAMYVLMNIAYYRSHPLDMLKIWEGGLVFSGGIIALLLTIPWYVRRHHLSFLKMCDLWAPAAAVGQAIGRIGCLMAGCCYGKPTDSKWGIVFTDPSSLAPRNLALHPTQIYSSISGFIIFFILLLIYSKKKFEGQVFLWFLILHSTARLAIERFRGDERGMLFGGTMSVTQLVATVVLFGAVITLLVLKSRRDGQTKGKTRSRS
ncbi:MAG: prolipoprotein diacylglyceryl transferase [Pseudomonadota bacterium]